MLPLQARGLGHLQRKEPLQVWCWRPIHQVGVLSAWLPMWPCLLLQSMRSPLGLVSASLCLYLSFLWVFIDKYLFHHLAAKMRRNIPPLLITEFPTRLLYQLPSASQWVLSFCPKRGAGEQSALSCGDTTLSSLWFVPLGVGTFIYQLVTLTGILLLTAGSRRLLVSLLNFLYMFFF